MRRSVFLPLAVLALIQLSLVILLSPPSLAQEWRVRAKPRGIIKVVDLFQPALAAANYQGVLIHKDKDNNWFPCLAEDWRWLDEKTIEFKLRQGATFHNGEEFNAEAVRINWEEYKKMEIPRAFRITIIPDDTVFEIVDDYTVRFSFPEPDGLALQKFWVFHQFAPAFFKDHKFNEGHWGYLPEAGPWAIGPFRLVEGGIPSFDQPSERIVLEAFEGYWDRRYPKVKRVIIDNRHTANRKEAMRLLRETEGSVDIINHIRPLDTLKIAESPYAKVVKSRDVTCLGGFFNQRKRESKWRDIRLRKAVNYAINRKELWKYAAKGNAYNTEGFFIPPGEFGYNPDLIPFTYDTTKARALLAEAGYPEGFDVKLISSEAWELEAQLIRRMLERVGLTITLNVMARTEWNRKIIIPYLDKPPEEQDWDITVDWLTDWYGQTGASFFPWGFLEESGWRWIEYDPVLERMWEEMLQTTEMGVQEAKVGQIAQYLYEGAYRLFIYSPLTLYGVNKEVEFVPRKDGLPCFWETSVTDKHWSIREENQ